MASEMRLLEMLAQWEEARDRGQPLTPQELCRDRPELFAELQQRIANLERLNAVLQTDPASRDGPTPTPPGDFVPHSARPSPAIPAVPGYEVLEELGSGGMGVVLKGRDPELGRDLAIKMLRPEHQHDPALVRRFIEEAQIAGQLQHPAIVPVYALGHFPDRGPYFTMKLIRGRTLAELLAQRPDPSHDLPRLLSIFEQVCQALAYAHSKGVIHRDLKPSNVMVGAFGEVQVMDWGLGKVLKPEPSIEEPQQPETSPAASAVRTVRSAGPGLSSQTGAVLGTYAYMPPEQALGRVEAMDERSDVFGLGAMLCEILTGTPPYGDSSGWQAHLLAAQGDLAGAWSRLDGCGADAELVGMAKTCLAPQPQDRPRDAGVVAGQITVYLASVQERLRRAELEAARTTARAAGERKARRLRVGLAAAVLLLGLGAGGGGLWWAQQRAEQERQVAEQVQAVNGDLEQVADLLRAWKLPEARTALVRAEGRVAGGGPANLLGQVGQMRDALTLVDALEGIRLKAGTVVGGKFDYVSADREYASLFQDRGLAVEGEDPTALAARVRGSPARAQLVAALDDWASATGSADRRAWLLEVARGAEPGDWSNRFRDPAVRGKRAALEQLAREADVAKLSPQLLAALGLALGRQGADPVPLLAAAQRRQAADFWLNFLLGHALQGAKRDEMALGYYRAAVAARPGTSVVHNNLGNALHEKGRLDEAIRELRTALDLEPNFAEAHNNLGITLHDKGQVDEAVREYRRALALAIAPKLAAGIHNNLGTALKDIDRLDDAIREFRTALDLDRNLAPAHNNLGRALAAKGQLDDAIREFRRSIDLEPRNAGTHSDLGVALKAKGRLGDAIQEYRTALALDPNMALAHYNLGNALKVEGRLAEAIPEYRAACELEPTNAKYHGAFGEALLKEGRFGEAQAATRRFLALLPANDPLHAYGTEQLRACQKRLQLEDRLLALLTAGAKAANALEQSEFGQLCALKKHYTAAARFYRDAFTADPPLAEDARQQHRYNAACAAALAGCGKGKDADQLNDQERAHWRNQALDWLRADLKRWAKALDNSDASARAQVQQAMQHWQTAPELVGVRDKEALAKLPADESAAWQKLWIAVDSLLERTREATR
jgi:serine/threonine-protein kinase